MRKFSLFSEKKGKRMYKVSGEGGKGFLKQVNERKTVKLRE